MPLAFLAPRAREECVDFSRLWDGDGADGVLGKNEILGAGAEGKKKSNADYKSH